MEKQQAVVNCTKEIRQLHIEVSNIITPREYIGEIKATGVEYPESEYMRAIKNKYFPTASWNIEEKPLFNSNRLVAWVVSGTLTWDYSYLGYPDIRCQGGMAAAHAVNYKKGTDTLLDLGNDVKAANTDTWKKALNLYLNICDDIYRWETPELSEEQKNKMKKLTEGLKDRGRAENIVKTLDLDSFTLNKENYSKWLSKINYELETQ
jgi:hypothetical protein